jgi:hypothetical protein
MPTLKAGQKVKCIRGDQRIGLAEDAVYTIERVFKDLYFAPGEITYQIDDQTFGTPNEFKATEGPVCVNFKRPTVTLLELEYPYFLDADRFEAIATK